ncbi:hypothetical protein PF001_g33040, partial [Phytophthora fragariae]
MPRTGWMLAASLVPFSSTRHPRDATVFLLRAVVAIATDSTPLPSFCSSLSSCCSRARALGWRPDGSPAFLRFRIGGSLSTTRSEEASSSCTL